MNTTHKLAAPNELVSYIAGLIYKKYLQSNKSRLWSILKNLLVKVLNDPACKLDVHGTPLYLPLSHALPGYLHDFPMYDRLPKRIGNFLRTRQGFVCLIDVGANVGDTLAAIQDRQFLNGIFMAIEPNEHFRKYLTLNWGNSTNVKILPYLCVGEENSTHQYQIIESNGTARVVENNNGIALPERTIDQIVAEKHDFEKCNFFKTDTDGYDFEVIKGSMKLIKSNLPAVLFECDVFSNENYLADCINSLNFFKEAGYVSFLLYDNFGYFMGTYSLSDLNSFTNLLFYQLTSLFYYFDILLMKEADIVVFQKMELKHYSALIKNRPAQRAVQSLIVE